MNQQSSGSAEVWDCLVSVICAIIWLPLGERTIGFTQQAAEAGVLLRPFPGEGVAQMVAHSGPELYLFSSDYPHAEGGRNPLARFEASLSGFDDRVLDQFYSGNMARLIGA